MWVRSEKDKKKSQSCPKLLKAIGEKSKKGQEFLVLVVKVKLRSLPFAALATEIQVSATWRSC